MTTGKIIAVSTIVLFAGAGIYYFVIRKMLPGANVGAQNTFGGDAGNANTGGVINVAVPYVNNYCNPPIPPDDPQRELKKFYYRKQFAEQAWNTQGRGMSLDYFMQEFGKQQGC